MIRRSSTPLFLGECPPAVSAPRMAMRAYMVCVTALGGIVGAAFLMMSVAANSGSEAERIAAARDDGYPAMLVSALSVNFAKPLR
jgi:hypothetical protein